MTRLLNRLHSFAVITPAWPDIRLVVSLEIFVRSLLRRRVSEHRALHQPSIGVVYRSTKTPASCIVYFHFACFHFFLHCLPHPAFFTSVPNIFATRFTEFAQPMSDFQASLPTVPNAPPLLYAFSNISG